MNNPELKQQVDNDAFDISRSFPHPDAGKQDHRTTALFGGGAIQRQSKERSKERNGKILLKIRLDGNRKQRGFHVTSSVMQSGLSKKESMS